VVDISFLNNFDISFLFVKVYWCLYQSWLGQSLRTKPNGFTWTQTHLKTRLHGSTWTWTRFKTRPMMKIWLGGTIRNNLRNILKNGHEMFGRKFLFFFCFFFVFFFFFLLLHAWKQRFWLFVGWNTRFFLFIFDGQ